MTANRSTDQALIDLARDDSGRVLASLARRFNSLDLADEAVQEAMIEASQRWPVDGVPGNPGGWLYRVAQRKAIDLTRRAGAERRRFEAAAPELSFPEPTAGSEMSTPLVDPDGAPVEDERLRLILLCCHPALSPEAQIALTLRLVGGLSTDEIAASFLVPTPTLAARITRAKKKIRAANIPLSVPDELDSRMSSVLAVLYLIFNEGYLSHGATEGPMRVDLCNEAIRLTAVVASLATTSAEARGLLILLTLIHARRDARFSDDGQLILLDDQDRGRWHLNEIKAGTHMLGETMKMMQPGSYQLQALIAVHHSNARTAADTDWPRIVALYDQLVAMESNPVVALNRAVSIAMADGPLAGLRELDSIQGLDSYHLFHSARGELLERSGDTAAARLAFARAIELASNPSELDHLASKIERLPS